MHNRLLSSTFYICSLLSIILLCNLRTYAQTARHVTGKVTDREKGALSGVTVILKGTGVSAITDENGSFSLNLPAGDGTLVFSSIGFDSQEIPVGDKRVINVALQTNASALKGVVVIGYGTQSRADVTTSISRLDDKVLENIPFSNAASAMEGTIPGVRVQSTSGQPGAQPRVIVRGGTSINDPNGATPLYVIDGIIKNDMNDISADDIESLQVLKDAASTAIYGARGSNGVVVITTKSGKAGRTRVSYGYDLTFSQVGKKYDLASAKDYIYYGRLGTQVAERYGQGGASALASPTGYGTGNDLTNATYFTTQYLTPDNAYKLQEGWQSMPDPIDPAKTIIYKSTDWQDVLYRTAVSHNHYVNVTGGSEKATFNAGVGYQTNDGIAITTDYRRLTFNLTGKLNVSKNLNFTGQALYSHSSDNEVYNNWSVFFRSASMAPTAKYEFEDGTLAPGFSISIGNPAYFLNKNPTQNSTDRLTISLGGHWGILPGLSFDPQVSLYKIANDSYSFKPSYLDHGRNITTRQSTASYAKNMNYQADAVLSYNKKIASSHSLDIKTGFSYFGRDNFNITAVGQGAGTDLIPTLNASATPLSVYGAVSSQIILGYFGRVNYNYNEKYLLSFSGRYDGASNLGQKKWGFFPGVSAGWNLYKEDFWNSIVSEDLLRLKLRGSYGVTGNIGGLSDYAAQGEYAVGRRYLDQPAIENTVIANNLLEWEQSQTLDIGADLSVFNGRVTILADYYRRVTKNLLTNLSLPFSTGFSSIFTNLGSLQNKGFELELGAQVLPSSSKFQWNVSFNVAKTNSKILKLPPSGAAKNRVGGFYVWNGKNDYEWVGGLQEGGRIGDMYAWKQAGIFATADEAAKAPVDMISPYTDKTKYPGDVNYFDKDHNDTIDTRDFVYMGNPYPVWTGGITNTFSYKNFALTLRMDYMTGYTIYNEASIFLAGEWAGNLNFPSFMTTSGWHKEGDRAKYAQFISGDNYNYWRGGDNAANTNSQFFQSGNFLCVRELTLSYKVPSTVLSRVKLHDLRFNITGGNLYYFTRYQGINPEDGGLDDGRYPVPRTLTFGLNASF